MSTSSSDSIVPAGFESLGLNPALLAALAALGYEEPTPIQRQALPLLLEGRDVLGQAATGTGKTAAFALPLLQKLTPGVCEPFQASALVLVPTRELAMQVAEAVHSYGKSLGVSVLPVYGGQEISQQLRRLKRGIDVVVATPGRALDHLRRKTLKLERVSMVVLDEADEMLDLGFADDLDAILSALPRERQTALFSATLPPRIAAIAERHLQSPARVHIPHDRNAAGTVPKVRQTAYVVTRNQKNAALGRILDLESPRSTIVFCRTRNEVDTLTDTLNGHGHKAEALHGGMSQDQRDRVLTRFKGGKAEFLVATDVAARGLHVENLSHVINYDLPTEPEAYVHRIGRTGRAGREGVAISLAEPRESRLLKNIERVTRQRIEIARLPSVADIEAKKLDAMKESLREVLTGGELDSYRSLVESLVSEFGPMDIAAAAIKLAHAPAAKDTEETDLLASAPAFTPSAARPERTKPSRKPSPRTFEAPAASGGSAAASPGDAALPSAEAPRAEAERRPERPVSRGKPTSGPMIKLFVSLGTGAGLRPADIVGAIVNESGIQSRDVGAIEILERHSTVEVPERLAGRVVEALRMTTMRGRKVSVQPDRGAGAAKPAAASRPGFSGPPRSGPPRKPGPLSRPRPPTGKSGPPRKR